MTARCKYIIIPTIYTECNNGPMTKMRNKLQTKKLYVYEKTADAFLPNHSPNPNTDHNHVA